MVCRRPPEQKPNSPRKMEKDLLNGHLSSLYKLENNWLIRIHNDGIAGGSLLVEYKTFQIIGGFDPEWYVLSQEDRLMC